MTTEEKIKKLKALAAVNSRQSAKAAAKRLSRTGIYTEKGNLKRVYGGTKKQPA